MPNQGTNSAAPAHQAQHTPNYLRTSAVAAILHVFPKAIARWAQQDRLPFQRTLGGHRRYPEAAIHQLAASLAQEVRAG
jgi:predicted site-specific integrase-resolvase